MAHVSPHVEHHKKGIPIKDRSGERCGLLVGIRAEDRTNSGAIRWYYKCDCGGSTVVTPSAARATGHCGCIIRPRVRVIHGRAKTPLYKAWHSMKARCLNPKNSAFSDYGGRGIRVCKRWLRFENFLSDMGERPDGLTIERKNNNGHYTPSNCLWATRKQQQRNRRANRTHKGKCIAEWAEISCLTYSAISNRLSNGWRFEDAVSLPLNSRKPNYARTN